MSIEAVTGEALVVGGEARVCVTVSRSVAVRVQGLGDSVLDLGMVRRSACRNVPLTPPEGTRTVRADALENGRVVRSFPIPIFIGSLPVTASPTATDTPTPTPTPETPTPTPTPTDTPTPIATQIPTVTPAPIGDGGDLPAWVWPAVLGGLGLFIVAGGIVLAQQLSVPMLPERIVRTGFAPVDEAGKALRRGATLAPDRDYWFWIEINSRFTGRGFRRWFRLARTAAADVADLTVAIFPFREEIVVVPGSDTGVARVATDGAASVVRHGAVPATLAGENRLLRGRMYFPVRSPAREGAARVRCNIYRNQVLVQSRIVRVRVSGLARWGRSIIGSMAGGLVPGWRQRTVIDYRLSRTLHPEQLTQFAPHRLSILLNCNADGSHSLRFFGSDEQRFFKDDAVLHAADLDKTREDLRRRLRFMAWGSEDDWREDLNYRFSASTNPEQLLQELLPLARAGWRMHAAFINRLTGGEEKSDELVNLMRQPGGLVQVAVREDARNVFPAEMIYDYYLDTNRPDSEYRLCEDFRSSLREARPLEQTICFNQPCSGRDKDGYETVICPSGFWGFRHMVGTPLSLRGAPEVSPEMLVDRAPQMLVSASTDPLFELWGEHARALRGMRQDLDWRCATDGAEMLSLMRSMTPHLVYFYCHGGILNRMPYILVGPPSDRGITPDTFHRRIRWKARRPLVFLNGCRTTALSSDLALTFVGAFVEHANAAGVIGTQITVFEPLARAFAEECLYRFLAGWPIGAAVRDARLALLRTGNPLGMAYTPYVIADLHLTPAVTATNPRVAGMEAAGG